MIFFWLSRVNQMYYRKCTTFWKKLITSAFSKWLYIFYSLFGLPVVIKIPQSCFFWGHPVYLVILRIFEKNISSLPPQPPCHLHYSCCYCCPHHHPSPHHPHCHPCHCCPHYCHPHPPPHCPPTPPLASPMHYCTGLFQNTSFKSRPRHLDM